VRGQFVNCRYAFGVWACLPALYVRDEVGVEELGAKTGASEGGAPGLFAGLLRLVALVRYVRLIRVSMPCEGNAPRTRIWYSGDFGPQFFAACWTNSFVGKPGMCPFSRAVGSCSLRFGVSKADMWICSQRLARA